MSAETWWNQIGAYNNAIFPMQIIIMAVAVALTYFLFAKPGPKTNKMMKAYLVFTFAWNGIIFFLIFGKELPGTFLGAPLCILVAILFAWDISANKTQFTFPNINWQRYLMMFWILLAFLYPLIGLAFGHYYPNTCIFGVMPCPTTVFALALLASAIPKVDKKVYILLLLWALPAFGKCLGALDLYEDCVVFWIGIYALFMLIKNWKVIGK
ncbi:hypothetical protein ES703_19904 [subsurface metagenome]